MVFRFEAPAMLFLIPVSFQGVQKRSQKPHLTLTSAGKSEQTPGESIPEHPIHMKGTETESDKGWCGWRDQHACCRTSAISCPVPVPLKVLVVPNGCKRVPLQSSQAPPAPNVPGSSEKTAKLYFENHIPSEPPPSPQINVGCGHWLVGNENGCFF